MFSQMITEMLKKQGVTDQLRAIGQMTWIGKKNTIHNSALGIINTELTYS